MAFSLNVKTYEDIGASSQMTYASYRGDRMGLFTFNDSADAGTTPMPIDLVDSTMTSRS